MRVSLDWTPQPAAPGTLRAELSWQAEPGTASKLASALRGWMHLRFEVTEEPSAGAEGERYSVHPDPGDVPRRHRRPRRHHGARGPAARDRRARPAGDGRDLAEPSSSKLLGKPWDDELETFRYAGDGAPVRWLHQVV